MSGILYPAVIMGALGLIFGALLAFASQKFFVPVDERQANIRALLPGANCGGCGYPGCDGFAEALVAGDAKVTGCAAGGSDMAKEIAVILGVEAADMEPKIAFLKCLGTRDKIVKACIYSGTHDCREAAVVPGRGPSSCPFGCLGLGTCVDVCQFGAMTIENGIASVDAEKCVGCGTCVEQCPRGVLTLIPAKSHVHVACNSPFKGPDVKKVCQAGCIGCTLCVKSCPVGAIEMKGALAVIDSAKCTNCGVCVTKCPVKNIKDITVKQDTSKAAVA